MHLSGKSLRSIEKSNGFNRKELADWVLRYIRHGATGLKSISWICEIYGVKRSTVKKRVNIVRREGYDALKGAREGERSLI